MEGRWEEVVVEVRRREWLRGEGAWRSSLLRLRDGKMCCLGFACLAMGKSVKAISEVGMPEELLNCPERLYDSSTEEMVRVNDDKTITDQMREEGLVELGMGIGIVFVFVD